MAGFKIACGMAVAFIAFVVCSLLLIHVCVCVSKKDSALERVTIPLKCLSSCLCISWQKFREM